MRMMRVYVLSLFQYDYVNESQLKIHTYKLINLLKITGFSSLLAFEVFVGYVFRTDWTHVALSKSLHSEISLKAGVVYVQL
jgi:hypothetical protein